MLLFWWAISGGRLISADLLPSPPQVWAAAVEILRDGYRGTTLAGNILSTLGRLGGGFGLAVVTGIPLGLWMGRNRLAGAAIDWIIQFLRPLPPLSYMILLILWLGTGDASKAALLFLTAFPIVARRVPPASAVSSASASRRPRRSAPPAARSSATSCCPRRRR